MKERKIVLAMLLIAVAFISFCLGMFLAKRHEPDTVTITTGKTPVSQAASDAAQQTEPSESADYISGRLNINTASAEDFALLPGIGEALAQRIVDYRTANGPFTEVSELCNVSGIGDKRLEAILEYITVE